MSGNYRGAVDSDRQSGGGRVVETFYDLCQRIWAGFSATESIASGVESSCHNTNNDSYNVPVDFNPENDGDTRNTHDERRNETGFSKTQTQEEGTVLLECLRPDEGVQLLENQPQEEGNTQSLPSRSEKMSTFLKKRRHKRVEKTFPKVSVAQQKIIFSYMG